MQTRKWTDKDGVERESWELKADQMQMLGGKTEGGQAPAQQQRPASQPAQPPAGGGYVDDDIPFSPVGRGMASYVI
jgi:single-strand DNA-binding protein